MLLSLLITGLMSIGEPLNSGAFRLDDCDPYDLYEDWNFFGGIGTRTPYDFKTICDKAKREGLTVRVTIDSYGGSAIAGWRLALFSQDYEVHTIAGSLLGANSAAGMWWLGGDKRTFESEGSIVALHRAFFDDDLLGWSYEYCDTIHAIEDLIYKIFLDPVVSSRTIEYLNIGRDQFGPQAYVCFVKTDKGVVLQFFNGNDKPKILLTESNKALKEWRVKDVHRTNTNRRRNNSNALENTKRARVYIFSHQ